MRYACRSVLHVYRIRLDDKLFHALFPSAAADCSTSCFFNSRSRLIESHSRLRAIDYSLKKKKKNRREKNVLLLFLHSITFMQTDLIWFFTCSFIGSTAPSASVRVMSTTSPTRSRSTCTIGWDWTRKERRSTIGTIINSTRSCPSAAAGSCRWIRVPGRRRPTSIHGYRPDSVLIK